MGIMVKLRERTHYVIYLLVFAFGIIWVLQDSGGIDAVGQLNADAIALVDGDKISVNEFNAAYDQQRQQYEQRSGQPLPATLTDQMRDQVYSGLIENKLREREIERLGLSVTDSEVYEMIMGDTPHPVALQLFADSTGGINRAYIESIAEDPAAQEFFNVRRDYLKQIRTQEKLDNAITSSVRVTDADIDESYRQQNYRANAEYVALPYAAVSDSMVSVTDSELRSYYNTHKDDYEQPLTWNVEYISVPKLPSGEDSIATQEHLATLVAGFETAEDDSSYLVRVGSQDNFTRSFFSRSELGTQISEAIFSDLTIGRVTEAVTAQNKVHYVKIMGTRPAAEESIHARHILIGTVASAGSADTEFFQRAQAIKDRLAAGEDFDTVARQESSEPSAASTGGDLGWFKRDGMVAEFSAAAFSAPVGQVVGPIKTQFGYHLIEVLGKADQEVQVAVLSEAIQADDGTRRIASIVDDVQYYSAEGGSFAEEAGKYNLEIKTLSVQEGMQFVPGLPYDATRRTLNFLKESEEGSYSDVFEFDREFIVLHVSSISEKGFRSFNSVKAEITPRVRLELKKGVQETAMRDALAAGDFDGLAARIGSELRIATAINFNTTTVPGLGNDPAFVGTVVGLTEGAVSSVTGGNNAAFVVRVTSVTEPNVESLSAATREQMRAELFNTKKQEVLTNWLKSLREAAEVVDNRSRFNL